MLSLHLTWSWLAGRAVHSSAGDPAAAQPAAHQLAGPARSEPEDGDLLKVCTSACKLNMRGVGDLGRPKSCDQQGATMSPAATQELSLEMRSGWRSSQCLLLEGGQVAVGTAQAADVRLRRPPMAQSGTACSSRARHS